MPMLGAINGMLAQARQHYGQPRPQQQPQQPQGPMRLPARGMGAMAVGQPGPFPQQPPQDEPSMGGSMGQPFLSAVQMFNSLNRGMR